MIITNKNNIRAKRMCTMPWWRHEIWEHFPRYWPFVCVCVGGGGGGWGGCWPVIGKFPSQRPVTRSFNVCFDLRANKRLSKQSGRWWSGTPSRPLWCHYNGTDMDSQILYYSNIVLKPNHHRMKWGHLFCQVLHQFPNSKKQLSYPMSYFQMISLLWVSNSIAVGSLA